MEAERIARWVSVVNAVLWSVLLAIWIRNALVSPAPAPAELLGSPLYPPIPLFQVEPVARYIVGALYSVFKWTLIAVLIVSGIGAALGLVSEYIAFVGIRVPRASLRTLLSHTVQLMLMKVVVDAALRYFGYAQLQLALEPFEVWGTWVGYLSLSLGAALGGLLLLHALKHEIEIRW